MPDVRERRKQAFTPEQRERRRQFERDRYQNNKDHYKAAHKAYYKANRERLLVYYRSEWLKQYGLTKETYQVMVNAQEGRCAVCRRKPQDCNRRNENLAVDHNHLTGKVRGLLCHHCNVAIGLASESADRLEMLARYLRERD
jgi:hypothetical protein